MLQKAIQEDKNVDEAFKAMRFGPIEKELLDGCRSLGDVRHRIGTYFIAHLSPIRMQMEEESSKLVKDIEMALKESTNLKDLISVAKSLYKDIFDLKIKYLARLKLKVFYPKKREDEADPKYFAEIEANASLHNALIEGVPTYFPTELVSHRQSDLAWTKKRERGEDNLGSYYANKRVPPEKSQSYDEYLQV